MSRFRFIRDEKACFPVSVLCRVLRVSRPGYYAWARRGPSAHDDDDAVLLKEIRAVHTQSRTTYGSPRTQAALAANGRKVSRKRVARSVDAPGVKRRRKVPV